MTTYLFGFLFYHFDKIFFRPEENTFIPVACGFFTNLLKQYALAIRNFNRTKGKKS